jgi:hypothetical protein
LNSGLALIYLSRFDGDVLAASKQPKTTWATFVSAVNAQGYEITFFKSHQGNE